MFSIRFEWFKGSFISEITHWETITDIIPKVGDRIILQDFNIEGKVTLIQRRFKIDYDELYIVTLGKI